MNFCDASYTSFVPLNGYPPSWSRRRIFSGSTDPGTTPSTQPCAHLSGETQTLRKIDVLKYKKNSLKLSKSQRFSRIVKGYGPNGKYRWATQTIDYSNPNNLSYNYKNSNRKTNILMCNNSGLGNYPYMCWTAGTCQ
tara:strand:- start:1140 stop:1550 length:411 start_codon:yes stop_codon:yes gene_type:complete